MTERIYNFSAGPAVLPEPVLEQAREDLWSLGDSGVGILEHSHRGGPFDAVIEAAEADCRSLAGLGDDHAVLFLQGGASTQFFMLPANLLPEGGTADYVNTGSWSKKAIKEAKLYGNVHVAGSSEDENFSYIPDLASLSCSDSPTYLHFTSNNTIFGTQFPSEPTPPAGAFLACDGSSDAFSRPIDLTRYGVYYAGAQKNLGPSGVTLVVIRRDLLERKERELPTMLRYATHAEQGSRYNTPPTFGIYLMGRVFRWIQDQGGLELLGKQNEEKAALLYDVLDESAFYEAAAKAGTRSLMNVTFRTPSPELDAQFVKESEAAGLSGLKGHRSVGGMRASIYNAFPRQGCQVLAEFMKDFAQRNG